MAPAKKSQNQKMSLGDFLTDESLGSWADEMENMPMAPTESRTGYGERRAYSTTGDRFGSGFDRGSFGREQLPVPDKPPYTAHVGNLSFEVTESDVMDYFSGCSVTNVRIVEDKLERKPKGFGYVEFGTVDGLKKALESDGAQFSGRNIRVSVADPPKDRPEARDITDWTRKGPLPSLPSEQRRGSERGFGSRNLDNASDAGSDRGDRRRMLFDQNDGKVRDFGNWERKGPLSPLPRTVGDDGGRPRTRDGPRDRRQSPAWGEGRSQDGSRPPRREFAERPLVDRAPTAPEIDNQWRSKMRPDPPPKSPTPSRETSNPPSPAAPAAPTVRPRLNLQKRTVSEAESLSPASAVSEAKPSPFGGARPIDTFAREKEIEEKRQLAIRQKKEQEDKAREEKRAAKEAAEAAKTEKPAPAIEANNDKNDKNEKPDKNGDGVKPLQSTSNFEILRRTSGGGEVDEDVDEDAEVESKNGGVIDDKEVKPKEIVRELSPKITTDVKKPEPSATGVEEHSEPSTAALESDGWSTVSKTKNSRRGPNQTARAIAS